MDHSLRTKTNMTNQMRAQLKFLQDDLKHEEKALIRAKSFKKFNLPGTTTLIKRHESGVKKTKLDILALKNRIMRYQKEGKINKIL